MDKTIAQNYLQILREELKPALGCTEPIAVAFCAAKAAQVLGKTPDHVDLWCSGNIIKNVKAVVVPHSGGMRGPEIAAILGVLGGDSDQELQVLESVKQSHIDTASRLYEAGFCTCHLESDVDNLYIRVLVQSGSETSEVEVQNTHTNITGIRKNGVSLKLNRRNANCQEETPKGDRNLLNLHDIWEFANTVSLDEVKPLLDQQIALNSAIADEGLTGSYGANVGRTLLQVYGDDVKIRAKARAAAGSDARMNGCPLPVMINSGSGNQGMTVSLPVIEFAKELNVGQEKLYRALVLSNLTALYQKFFIGRLSAYCGAVSAACGSGAAITFLHGGSFEEICRTITNTIATVGGIVCDGAKSSCAAKIAASVDAAILAHQMSMSGAAFRAGEGLVGEDTDTTIQNIGYVGRVGMKDTDEQILKIMLRTKSAAI